MPNFRVTVEMIVNAANEDAAQDEALAACRMADDNEDVMSYDAKGAELVEDLDDVELGPRAHFRVTFENAPTPYAELIANDLAMLEVTDIDPRHVEAYMRVEHATLDALDPGQFVQAVLIALDCIREQGTVEAEKVAQSYGL